MRVVAGRLGGRPLVAPHGSATRPTSDRVREALFQVLGPFDDKRVADLYAGTGALGIEAISRGAAFVTFVESGRAALAALRKNIATLGIETSSAVLPVPVERAARALGKFGPYDLILCDPPWADLGRALRTIGKIVHHLELRPEADLVIEHPARGAAPESPDPRFGLADRRSWGDTAVSVFRLGFPAVRNVAESTEKV